MPLFDTSFFRRRRRARASEPVQTEPVVVEAPAPEVVAPPRSEPVVDPVHAEALRLEQDYFSAMTVANSPVSGFGDDGELRYADDSESPALDAACDRATEALFEHLKTHPELREEDHWRYWYKDMEDSEAAFRDPSGVVLTDRDGHPLTDDVINDAAHDAHDARYLREREETVQFYMKDMTPERAAEIIASRDEERTHATECNFDASTCGDCATVEHRDFPEIDDRQDMAEAASRVLAAAERQAPVQETQTPAPETQSRGLSL